MMGYNIIVSSNEQISIKLIESLQKAIPSLTFSEAKNILTNMAKSRLNKLACLVYSNVSISDLPKLVDKKNAEIFSQKFDAFIELEPNLILFPKDSIFDTILFSKQLIAFSEENFINWSQKFKIYESYRLTLLPSFSPPLLIRIWKISERNFYQGIIKLGCADNYFEVFPLKEESEFQINEIDSFSFSSLIKTIDFWNRHEMSLDNNNSSITLDGTLILFEGSKNKKYQAFDKTIFPNEMVEQLCKLFFTIIPKKYQKYFIIE